jgi:hypothetical protein
MPRKGVWRHEHSLWKQFATRRARWAWGETLPRMSFDFNPAIRPKRKRKRNDRRTQRRR